MTISTRFAGGLCVGGLLFVLAAACSSSSSSEDGVGADVRSHGLAFTDAQKRILGFETPLADWSDVTGWQNNTDLSVSASASTGSHALAVKVGNRTILESAVLGDLGQIGAGVSVDIAVPSELVWGDLTLAISSTSAGWQQLQLGQRPLATLPSGSYQTLRFPLPVEVLGKLNEGLSDARLVLILNTEPKPTPYLLDNLALTSVDDPGEPGALPLVELAMDLPKWARPAASAVTALDRLVIGDRAQVSKEGVGPAAVANAGDTATDLGVSSSVGNVTSVADVNLRNFAVVEGGVQTSGSISYQDGAEVLGGVEEALPLPPTNVLFAIESFSGPDVAAEGSLLAPGVYGKLSVQEDKDVILGAGTYFFSDIYVAPQRRIRLSSAGGPIVVFVSGNVTIHGSVDALSPGSASRWILAYSGTEDVSFGGQTNGALFAPFAKVKLSAGGNHWGTVLAKEVELAPDALFVHDSLEEQFDELCDATHGIGGFCGGVDGEQGTGECLFALQPFAVGRSGHDPFTFKDLIASLNFSEKLTSYLNALDASPRVFVKSYLDSSADLGYGWGPDVDANVVAWGDIDRDGRDELIVGRNDIKSGDRVKVFDDAQTGFREIQGFGSGWGKDYYPHSIATGDYDGDGDDEVVIGRNSPSGGNEVFVYDGKGLDLVDQVEGYDGKSATNLTCVSPKVQLVLVKELDFGDRTAHDLVLANMDTDPELELGVAISGKNGNGANRVQIIQIGQFKDDPAAWDGAARSGFANWGDTSRSAISLAVGDFEGDGIPEVAVGRSEGGGDRMMVHRYNPQTNTYDQILAAGSNWEDNRATESIAFGDLDGDGDDEIVYGRSGDSDGKTEGPKLFIADLNPAGNALVSLKEFGDGWGAKIGVNDLDVGDIDGDHRDEIVAARSDNDNQRVFVYDDETTGFAEIGSFGDGWGNKRFAKTVAIAPRYTCQAFTPEPLPTALVPNDGTSEAEAAVDEEIERRIQVRREKLLEINAQDLMHKVQSCALESPLLQKGMAMFGPFEEPNGRPAIVKISEALATVSEFTHVGSRTADERSQLVSQQLVDIVDAYILDPNFKKFRDVGTHGDFDFEEMALLELLHKYRLRPDLLSDAAVDKLLNLDCTKTSSCTDGVCTEDLVCPDRTLPTLRTDLAFGLELPETENHTLMINTWHYLVSQWQGSPNPRSANLVAPANSPLEDKLLEIVNRVLTNGMWETNARPYSAYSTRALQILASYAANPNLKNGAQNALHYLATKTTFQSMHGRRSAPMRRQWENRARVQLDRSDYFSMQFGVLTGDYVHVDDIDCEGQRCKFKEGGPHQWAYEAATLEYRVPNVILGHLLNPQQNLPGGGSFARMMSRYREGDYDLNKDPVYDVPATPTQAVEPAHEFYFRTADYVNAAGGRYEPYSTFDSAFNQVAVKAILALGTHFLFDHASHEAASQVPLIAGGVGGGAIGLVQPLLPVPVWDLVWNPVTLLAAIELAQVGADELAEAKESALRNIDFLAKPTMLIGASDMGYWPDVSSAELQTLLFRGDHVDHWKSNNTGVFKNFAVGYSTHYTEGLKIPPAFRVAGEASNATMTVKVFDPATTRVLFPNEDYYLVVGRFFGVNGLGFYEVVPADRFSGPGVLADAVSVKNSSSASLTYVTMVSGDRITINPSYPNGAPFLSIAGSGIGDLTQVHHTGPGQTAGFPLMDVRAVDKDYNFTDMRYACAAGDGLLLVNNPTLGKRLIVDSRDKKAPKSCIDDLVKDDCQAVLDGNPPPSLSCD